MGASVGFVGGYAAVAEKIAAGCAARSGLAVATFGTLERERGRDALLVTAEVFASCVEF